MKKAIRFLILLLTALSLTSGAALAQSKRAARKAKATTTQKAKAKPVTGPDRKVAGVLQDSQTGEPLPFSNVFVRATLIGTQTDLDGRFAVTVPAAYDTLRFGAMGYEDKYILLSKTKGKLDTLVIKMRPDNIANDEVVIRPDDAPHRLLKAVIANKKRNDPTNHDRTQYEKYTRWE